MGWAPRNRRRVPARADGKQAIIASPWRNARKPAAIDQKLEDQRAFVAWWEETVTIRHGGGRGNKKITVPLSFSLADAEAKTGISNQQVSRWRGRLEEPGGKRR
jgi:hypothetical protein